MLISRTRRMVCNYLGAVLTGAVALWWLREASSGVVPIVVVFAVVGVWMLIDWILFDIDRRERHRQVRAIQAAEMAALEQRKQVTPPPPANVPRAPGMHESPRP